MGLIEASKYVPDECFVTNVDLVFVFAQNCVACQLVSVSSSHDNHRLCSDRICQYFNELRAILISCNNGQILD